MSSGPSRGRVLFPGRLLGEPVAMIPQGVAMAGEFKRLTDRSILRSTFGRRRLIEY
jgi:hypothetical protein